MASKPIFNRGNAQNYLDKDERTKSTKALAEEADKHNRIFMVNLTAAIGALPKYALGVMAATALDTAIRKTRKRTGRFAANWRLALNGEVPDPVPDPSVPGQEGQEYGSINDGSREFVKGAGGEWIQKPQDHRFSLRVLMAKRAYYGYRGKGGVMTLTPGRIAAALYPRAPELNPLSDKAPTADKSGRSKRILLYNPYMKPGQRRAGWSPLRHPASADRPYSDYTTYALGKGGLRVEMPGLIPELKERMAQLAQEVREATRDKKLIDPFKLGRPK